MHSIAVFASDNDIAAYMRGEEINPELPDMPKMFMEYQKSLREKMSTDVSEIDIKNSKDNTDLVRNARTEINAWAKKNIPKNDGLRYNVNLDEFKELTVRRSDIRSIVRHVHENAPKAYLLGKQLDKVLNKSEYLGWSEDEKIILPDGTEKQKHDNVGHWLYYKFTLEGKDSYINVKYDKLFNEYRVYCIRDSRFNTSIITFLKQKKNK